MNEELKKINDKMYERYMDALMEYRQWRKDNIAKFAKYPIGTVLYHVEKGTMLGEVVEHYFYSWDDKSTHVDYKYRVPGPNTIIDNTSRGNPTAFGVGTLEDVLEHRKQQVKYTEQLLRLEKSSRT